MGVNFCGGIKRCYFIGFLKNNLGGSDTNNSEKNMVTGDADTKGEGLRQPEASCHREKAGARMGDTIEPNTRGAMGSAERGSGGRTEQ